MIAPPSGFSRAGEGSVSLITGVSRMVLQKATVEYIPLLHLLHSVAQGCAGFSRNFSHLNVPECTDVNDIGRSHVL